MSTAGEHARTSHRRSSGETVGLRIAALGSLGVLTIAYLGVMLEVTGVVGGRIRLLIVAAAAIIAAFALATMLSPRSALKAAGGIFVLGLVAYGVATPAARTAFVSFTVLIRDILALLTGYTVLSIIGVDVWLAAILPAPLFLSWYFALRRRYAIAVMFGLVLLVFLTLTGDASATRAAIGIMGAAGAVGFGELARHEARVGDADLVTLLLAAMLVLSLTVSVIPTGGAAPITPGGGVGGPASTEASLLAPDSELVASGNPTLDPEVRFTVTADAPENWRADAFDVYTGTGWVQSGERTAFDGGPAIEDAEQTRLTVETEVDGVERLLAQWTPMSVEGVDHVTQTPGEGLLVPDGIDAGTEYTVLSEHPEATHDELHEADGAYPPGIVERYTQLPDTTPDRVGELTADLIEDTDSPYEAAVVIERYIKNTNEYSLDVSAPERDIADEQLFEREEGYCLYFASTMVAMLRTQDIPARLVTGYSSGERVAEDRWVVRGMNAHAWVEVYIPEYGWVEFDPTPSSPYDDARDEALEEAREDGIEGVDTDETGGEEWSPEPEDEEINDTPADGDIDGPDGPGISEPFVDEELAAHCENPGAIEEGLLTTEEAVVNCDRQQLQDLFGPETPGELDEHGYPAQATDLRGEYVETDDEDDGDPSSVLLDEQLALIVALLIGGIAGIHSTGMPDRVRYRVGIHWQGRTREPNGTIERAWGRLETYLSAQYGDRETGESTRAYVRRLSQDHRLPPGTLDVAQAHERTRYGTEPLDASEAREVVETVDRIVGRRLPGIDEFG